MRKLIACFALALLLVSCSLYTPSGTDNANEASSLHNNEQIIETPPVETTEPPEAPEPPKIVMHFGVSINVSWIEPSYGTIVDGGKSFDFVGALAGERRVKFARISDFVPRFLELNKTLSSYSETVSEPEPISILTEVLDREGAPIEAERPGEYLCKVTAEFEREGRRDTIVFEFTMVVVGEPEIIMLTENVPQGDPVVVRIDNAVEYGSYLLRLPYLENAATFTAVSYDGEGGVSVVALAPTPVATQAGNHTLSVEHNYSEGLFDSEFLNVIEKDYQVVKSSFKRQDLQTTSDTQAIYTSDNLNSDNEKMRLAYESAQPAFYFWDGFTYPLRETARISTEFAQSRYVNNKLQSTHSGIDLAAIRGSDVLATASGQVVLADELIVNGNTIIIDHGMGIFSSYSHLDSMAVAAGDMVNVGEVIGQVGSTGYSTGPHLHFTMRAGNYYVNPMFFIENDILSIN